MLKRLFEGGIGVGGLADTLNHDALGDMHLDIDPEGMPLAGYGNRAVTRLVKILCDRFTQTLFDSGAKRIANVQFFTGYRELHLSLLLVSSYARLWVV